MRLFSSWSSIFIFTVVGLIFFLFIIWTSTECDIHADCKGNNSFCVNQYCDCGHSINSYQCKDRKLYKTFYFPHYEEYRGYGNGFSVLCLCILAIGAISLTIIECWHTEKYVSLARYSPEIKGPSSIQRRWRP